MEEQLFQKLIIPWTIDFIFLQMDNRIIFKEVKNHWKLEIIISNYYFYAQ